MCVCVCVFAISKDIGVVTRSRVYSTYSLFEDVRVHCLKKEMWVGDKRWVHLAVRCVPPCAAPKRMAAPRRFMFFFCGRGKVGGGKNRLLRDESFESCLTQQRCSVLCVTVCFVNCRTFRLLTRRLSLESLWLLNFECTFRIK